MADRFIKIYDKILRWEWYRNINVKVLFLHLLLKANYKDLSFEGHLIRRGQLVTSLSSLSAETGLTPRQIRGSLEHLISTGEVASSSYPRYRVITVIHYDDYQSEGKRNGSQTASETAVKRQAEGNQTAGSGQAQGKQRATSIEYIEQIEQIEKKEQIEGSRTASRFTPPSRDQIISFCDEKGITVNVDRFLNYYTSNGWRVGRNPMKDWKATVLNWALKRDDPPASAPAKTVVAQQYEQRDYSQVTDDLMAEQAQMIEDAKRRGII